MSEPIRMQTQCPKCWEWCYPSEGCKRCATPKATMDNREKLVQALTHLQNAIVHLFESQRPTRDDYVIEEEILKAHQAIQALANPPKPEGKEA